MLQARVADGREFVQIKPPQLRQVVSILNSTSWRITKPLRLLSQLMGKPAADFSKINSLNDETLNHIAAALRRSNSWRITAPLRRLRSGQKF